MDTDFYSTLNLRRKRPARINSDKSRVDRERVDQKGDRIKGILTTKYTKDTKGRIKPKTETACLLPKFQNASSFVSFVCFVVYQMPCSLWFKCFGTVRIWL